jgi:hypothetical protein
MNRGTGKRKMVGLLAVGLVGILGACGSGNGGTGSGPGGASGTGAGSGSGTSSTSFHCCINSDAYECPNKTAFDACAGGDPQACFTKCGSDPMCLGQCMSMLGNNDPSQCTKVGQPVSSWCPSTGTASTGTGQSTGSGPPPPPGGCDGQACQFDADCPTGQNCDSATGHCFSLDADCVGNPCQFDADCPNNEGCDSATSTCFAK